MQKKVFLQNNTLDIFVAVCDGFVIVSYYVANSCDRDGFYNNKEEYIDRDYMSHLLCVLCW